MTSANDDGGGKTAGMAGAVVLCVGRGSMFVAECYHNNGRVAAGGYPGYFRMGTPLLGWKTG